MFVYEPNKTGLANNVSELLILNLRPHPRFLNTRVTRAVVKPAAPFGLAGKLETFVSAKLVAGLETRMIIKDYAECPLARDWTLFTSLTLSWCKDDANLRLVSDSIKQL